MLETLKHQQPECNDLPVTESVTLITDRHFNLLLCLIQAIMKHIKWTMEIQYAFG